MAYSSGVRRRRGVAMVDVILDGRSSSRRGCRLAALMFSAVAYSGCGDDPPAPAPPDPPIFAGFPDQVTFTSRHFRYHAHAGDLRACADALTTLEDHFAALQALLGFSWPSERRVDYWLFDSGGDFNSYMPCGQNVPICTIKSNVFTYALPDEHELVHAYLAATGLPPSFMIEGIATLLSSDSVPWSLASDLRSRLGAYDWHDFAAWRNVSPGGGDLGWYYILGSYLVRFLIDRFGMPAVISYYHATPYSADPDKIDAAFQSAFAMPLKDAITSALAVDYLDGPNLRPYLCSAPMVSLDDAPVDVPDRCGASFTDRRFQIDREMPLLVQAAAVPRAMSGPRLRSCDGQPSPRGGFESDGRLQTLAWLGPGTYGMRITSQSPFSYQVLSGDHQWSSHDCSIAEDHPLAITERRGMVALPRTGDTYFVGLSFAGTQARVFQVSPQNAPLQDIRLCRSCADAPASCPSIMSPPDAWDGEYILVVPTDVVPGGFLVVDHYDPTML